MAELVANCPRCAATSITFDVFASVFVLKQHGWLHWFEVFSVCRNCKRPTIFLISQNESEWNDRADFGSPHKFNGSLSRFFTADRFISLVDKARTEPPEHTPPNIAAVFNEASSSVAVSNWNAAGAMFRLAINLATQPLLPLEPTPGLTRRKRRDLGPRVEWLMENGRITSRPLQLV
jgi:hypothetical protein